MRSIKCVSILMIRYHKISNHTDSHKIIIGGSFKNCKVMKGGENNNY